MHNRPSFPCFIGGWKGAHHSWWLHNYFFKKYLRRLTCTSCVVSEQSNFRSLALPQYSLCIKYGGYFLPLRGSSKWFWGRLFVSRTVAEWLLLMPWSKQEKLEQIQFFLCEKRPRKNNKNCTPPIAAKKTADHNLVLTQEKNVATFLFNILIDSSFDADRHYALDLFQS